MRRCSWPQRLLKSSSAWAEDRALLGSNPSAVPGAGSNWGAALLPPLALRCPHRRVPAGPLAFSTKAKNPRGSGGQVPRLSKHCLQSASTLLRSPRDPQILLTSLSFYHQLENRGLARLSAGRKIYRKGDNPAGIPIIRDCQRVNY